MFDFNIPWKRRGMEDFYTPRERREMEHFYAPSKRREMEQLPEIGQKTLLGLSHSLFFILIRSTCWMI